MLTRPLERENRCVDRLHRTDCVAFDARNLHKASDRIAGEAEVVLDPDLGGILDLCRCSAHDLGETRCCHGTSGSDFTLAAEFRTGDRRTFLDESADAASGE